MSDADRLIDVTLDDQALPAPTPEMEQERRVAIFDLMETNSFRLRAEDAPKGPFRLTLTIRERRLIFALSGEEGATEIALSLGPLRPIIGDYFAICDSYADAVRRLPPSKIEAIDADRRRIHDEAAEILQDRLSANVAMNASTARRLFTLIAVLHQKV